MKTKRMLSFLLSIIMIFSITAGVDLSADAETSGNFTYILLDDCTAEITNYTGSATSVTIPSEIDGYTVTSIGRSAFEDCTSLRSVTIPDSVITIGDSSFFGCSGLSSVTIGNNVKTIEGAAFMGCFSLTSVKIPDSVTAIYSHAFNGCGNLTNVTIGNSVTSIGYCSFYNCKRLTSITIPDSVTVIGEHAFEMEHVFGDDFIGLKTVIMPASAKIYDKAFYNCVNIEKVTLTKGTGTMQNYNYLTTPWYQSKYHIEEIVIEDGVENISEKAFYGCEHLSSITIPDSVTSIGDDAFNGCIGLISVAIPYSVTSIGENAFSLVNNVEYNGSASGSPWGAKSVNGYVDGYLVYKDSTKKELLGCSTQATNVTIPDSVTSIGNYAFYNCKSLTSVTIPDSVTSIGNYAFRNCTSLTNVTIPDSVTSIGNYAFRNCTSLTSVTIPDSVTSIGGYAFYSCTGLTSIVISNSVTSIRNYAFASCTKLTSITIPNSVTDIGSSAFEYCNSLSSVIMGNGVKYIYYGAFYNCNSLKDVYYTGSEAEWKNILMWRENDRLKNARIHYNYCNHIIVIDSGIAPTCTQTGLTEGSHCSVCNEVLEAQEVIAELGHNYDELVTQPTCTELGYTTYTCTRCNDTYVDDYTNALGHNPVIDEAVAPTCTSSGLTEGSHCSVCNEVIVEQKVIAELGHDYKTVVTPPTCAEEGYTTYTCSRCNDSYIADYVNALGHKYDNGKITKAATCTSTGVMTFTCTECGAINTSAIQKTPHTYKTYTTKATLSKNGSVVTKCSVCDSTKSNTTIYYPKTISLSATSYTYDGKVKTPSVKVVGSNGKTISSSNYTVSYASGRKYVGKYAVKITFKGNYSGSKTLYFTINPKGTSISSLSAGSKKFTVKWKKQSTQTTGYQIQYSTSSKFSNAKTVTLTKNSYTSKSITKLSAKKKYYVRIRTYKKVGSTYYYSSWSKAKYVTTKK